MGLKIPTSLQYFSPSIFYALTWPDFEKNSFIFKNWKLFNTNNRRTRIPRGLGREIDVAGLLPLVNELIYKILFGSTASLYCLSMEIREAEFF